MGKARLYRVKVNWNWSIFCVDLKVHSEKLEYLTDRGKRVLDFWAFQPKAIITKISFHSQKYLCLHVLPIACTTQCNNALKDRKNYKMQWITLPFLLLWKCWNLIWFCSTYTEPCTHLEVGVSVDQAFWRNWPIQ